MEESSDTWTKILEDSKASGLNYEDAIKGLLLEKLTAVVKNPGDKVLYNEYVKFMQELSVMFEKLARFPKMISKFLFCVRTEIVNLFASVDKKHKQHKPWTQLILPPQFMATIGPVVSLLPSGQIVDLWKTIHYNLEEECIKKISDENDDQVGVHHFLSIVVELLHEFLISIKVADTSVPITQIEQITALMLKLKDGCLEKLGSALFKRKHDSTLLCAFLKLTYTWAELHALMLLYNSKYKTNSRVKNEIFTVAAIDLNDLQHDSPVVTEISSALVKSKAAFNLTCIHPYLNSKSWLRLCNSAIDSENSSCKILMVKLVAQKMKYLRTLQGKCSYIKNTSSHGNSTKETTENVTEDTSIEDIEKRNKELGERIREHIEEAGNFLWVEQSEWLTLQELHDVFLISSECLEPSQMIKLAGNFVRKMVSITSKGRNMEVEEDVEEDQGLPTSGVDSEKKDNLIEMETELIKLNDNPIFCTAVIFDLTREIIHRLGKMKLSKRFMKKLTNEIMSVENLTSLLQNFTGESTEEESGKPKKVSKSEVDKNESEKLDGFLNMVNELIENTVTNGTEKNPSVEFTGELIEDLLQFLCSLPIEDYTKEVKSFVALFSISVLLSVGPYGMDEGSQVNDLVGKLVTKCSSNSKGNVTLFGVKWEKLFKWLTINFDNYSLIVMKSLMSVILNNIYVSKTCVEDFEPILNDLCDKFGLDGRDESVEKILLIVQKFLAGLTTNTKTTLGAKSKLTPYIENHSKRVTSLVVDLLGKEESGFDMIFDKIEAILSSEKEEGVELDEGKVVMLTGLVHKLVDAQLEIEKRNQRRRIIEDYLYVVLNSTLHWKDYSITTCSNILDIQLKILRRRHALSSLKSLANCFISITAIPFKTIEDGAMFRKLFCQGASLLNAFTVHRLDVVSFRTHIDLQCFQYLVESLTMRADQNNKLTDSEIYDLIYCAHALERVCQSAKLGPKEFSRVSPYFVAILMRQSELFTVYPAVKNPLMSGCYKLLDLCDDHGVAQINSMLSIGSREIFKTTYDLYKKYYRYSGRS